MDSHPEAEMEVAVERAATSPGKDERRRTRSKESYKRGEKPQFKVPLPPRATPSAARNPKGREKGKGNEDELNMKLDWMMEEMMRMKDIIKGKRKSSRTDQGAYGRKEKREESVARKETRQEVKWSAVVANERNKPREKQQEKSIPKRDEQRKRKVAIATTTENVAKTIPASSKMRKLPKTAAVVLTCPPGQYNEVMREAKDKIDITKCGVEKGLGIKRTLTGALALEIPGPEGHIHADNLAEKLTTLFENREGVRVSRPTKMAELRIRDLEDSIKPDEITYVITQEGRCHHTEVRVGPINRGNDGFGAAWVRPP